MNDPTKPQPTATSVQRDDRDDLQIDIRAWLGDAREVVLIHAGERYRLRITANNKLILTK